MYWALTALGARMGSSGVIEWGFLANRFPPILFLNHGDHIFWLG